MSVRIRNVSIPLLMAAVLAPLAAQDEGKPEPERDPELQEKIDRFREAVTDREHARDAEATTLVDSFLRDYPDMHPRDQADVVDALGDVLLATRVRRDPEHRGLFNAVALALGEMGPVGARVLARAYKSPKFDDREWVAMRAVILKSIGKTEDPRQVDFLLDRASRDPEDKIMQAAGEALGNYEDADERIRKEIAKELIKKYNEIDGKSRASLDPNDPLVKRAKETLAAISRDWNQTLARLTGENHTTAADWQHFYNKHKHDRWDRSRGRR